MVFDFVCTFVALIIILKSQDIHGPCSFATLLASLFTSLPLGLTYKELVSE